MVTNVLEWLLLDRSCIPLLTRGSEARLLLLLTEFRLVVLAWVSAGSAFRVSNQGLKQFLVFLLESSNLLLIVLLLLIDASLHVLIDLGILLGFPL
jgi:hypothetical protein